MPNIVTSVLADYRGYDTLGEATVIFTAGVGVMLLFGPPAAPCVRARRGALMKARSHPSRRTKLLVPFILLFALYVQFHAEFGPGGGFQAGVIAAGTLILYAITFGVDAAKRIAPQRLVEPMIPLGALVFAATGAAGLMLGKNFLDYSVLAHDPPHGRGPRESPWSRPAC